MQKARELFDNNAHIILQHKAHTQQLFRAIFIVGHLSKTFDLDDEKFKGNKNVCINYSIKTIYIK